MKKIFLGFLAASLIVSVSFGVVTVRGSGEAKSIRVHRKVMRGKYIHDKDHARQTTILQQVSKNIEVSRGKYVPPQSARDVHPSTQY